MYIRVYTFVYRQTCSQLIKSKKKFKFRLSTIFFLQMKGALKMKGEMVLAKIEGSISDH